VFRTIEISEPGFLITISPVISDSNPSYQPLKRTYPHSFAAIGTVNSDRARRKNLINHTNSTSYHFGISIALSNNMETHPSDKMILEGRDAKKKTGNDLVTIRGIVIPADWDEKGNVVAVAVSTYDEIECLIENREKEMELKAFIREEVEVRGILREEKNRLIMKIKEYRVKPDLKPAQNSIKRKSRIKKR
jgi:hypothetical protein